MFNYLFKSFLIVCIFSLTSCGGGEDETAGVINSEISSNPPEPTSDSSPPSADSGTDAVISVPNQAVDIRVPVNFWVVTSQDILDVSYEVTDEELETYLARSNLIWAAADIEFFINKIERIEIEEEAAIELQQLIETPRNQRDRLTAQRVANSTGQLQITETEFNIVLMKVIGPVTATAFVRQSVIYVAERNLRGEVRRPSILAHELGHALSLRHVLTPNSQCNIMTTGDCGNFNPNFTVDSTLVKTLHPCQVDIAREQAVLGFTDVTLASSVTCVLATP